MKNIKGIKKILCLLGLILLVFFILKHFNLIEGMSSDYSFNRDILEPLKGNKVKNAVKKGVNAAKKGVNAAKKGGNNGGKGGKRGAQPVIKKGGGEEEDGDNINIYFR